MGIDTSKINGTRFMFTIAFFLQSSALLTSLIASLTLNNSWLSGLFAFFACIPLIYIYKTIMVKFPDKNLIQVLKIVYGKIFGSIIGATYVWFFLTLTALSISDLGDFAKITVMFQTPKIVLTLLCIIVSVFAVRHGLGVVTRYSAAFTFLEFAIVGLSILLVLNQLDFSNFLPIFNLPIGKYLQSIHIASTIPMGELMVFLMLHQTLKLIRKK